MEIDLEMVLQLKIAYMYCTVLAALGILTLAVITPVYFTPNRYTWTVAFLLLFIAICVGYSRALRSWGL